ncbi:DUF1566 domain-containing protein [Thiorhodococcus mannitoliphagus]|uniref:DUF1566 domain-containing protein n=2 Tax=Thiorhodococcus mannitoliphagus TaxID=329406 RepID=A0A6P1E4C9_9GAMM|nr:DUF1566 domain-containing protein [Thiorhodococcus mannitoliphagus]
MPARLWLLVFGVVVFVASATARECQDEALPDMPSPRFVVIQNGTVKDASTGLMWKQCAEGLGGIGCVRGETMSLSWQSAMQRAQTSTFAGHADWRLPDRDELMSLLERRCFGLDIDGVAFPNTQPGRFWSSTPANYYPGSAWRVHFGTGDMDYGMKRQSAFVRLVRDAHACTPARPSTCLPHEDRLYEPHGSVEELAE